MQTPSALTKFALKNVYILSVYRLISDQPVLKVLAIL